ncbi:hypothetical protein LEN26_001600 [Aphanomyces euteiches]|nr:hypothetical protein AeMF1_013252 [Aphanomyces euteiches]KAH9161044.1 hypothetical protein LEN26_001600 [Aphanomyces euteiches]KAH9186591.1 hypothetical protein AeNC1_011432 [Aphanomyces euteiches]
MPRMAKTLGVSTTNRVNAAVNRALAGETCIAAARTTAVPYSTFTAHVRAAKAGRQLRAKGRPQALSRLAENDLVAWIIGMQQQGFPVKRRDVIIKACKMGRKINPNFILGGGWYKRFRDRHPVLADRRAQTISRARNSVESSDIDVLFDLMQGQITKHSLSETRIWNMDETAFFTRKKGDKVIAVKGSRNVWREMVDASFHLSIVACVRADGYVQPPTYIFPGDSIERAIVSSSSVPGATVTTAPKGWMNEEIFIAWLQKFSVSIPPENRPSLLIVDGLAAHCTFDVIELAQELGIIILCLPSNATHLLQPLDVAVFKSFRTAIGKGIFEAMINEDSDILFSISKSKALEIASSAWLEEFCQKTLSRDLRAVAFGH